jgi:hypothetical protein
MTAGTFNDSRLCFPKETPMPKFYFNFQNANALAKDETGVDLPGVEDAREAALASARELLAEHVKQDSKIPLETVIVTDESGKELMRIPARDVLPEPLKKQVDVPGATDDV